MPRRTFPAPDVLLPLLQEILKRAEEQGIEEGELARRAGADPSTLSRLKARGNGEFGLVAKLASVVGMRVVVVPDDEQLVALRKGRFFK